MIDIIFNLIRWGINLYIIYAIVRFAIDVYHERKRP